MWHSKWYFDFPFTLLIFILLYFVKYLANHQIVEFNNCEEVEIDNSNFIRKIFLQAAKLGEVTIVNECFHEFSPYGVTGVLVIAESHMSIHTWPEYKYVAVDIFSCGDKIDFDKIIDHLKNKLKCKNSSSININRGKLDNLNNLEYNDD